ncbi:hypothetical protein [Peribacillus kribbensis]|uniref:hypothetical protein n=1 Tax=Peribacillus kribbensis TaxID=356658 RepID=UPI0003F77B3F|nr:hypothetical protein [Peribacillus kribbensis]
MTVVSFGKAVEKRKKAAGELVVDNAVADLTQELDAVYKKLDEVSIKFSQGVVINEGLNDEYSTLIKDFVEESGLKAQFLTFLDRKKSDAYLVDVEQLMDDLK